MITKVKKCTQKKRFYGYCKDDVYSSTHFYKVSCYVSSLRMTQFLNAVGVEQFKKLCDEKVIVWKLTNPYTPQQNGVAERRNHTLLEMVRFMMAQENLPVSYWGDALLTAAYILNHVPSKSVTSTPYELWTGRKLDLMHLRPWGPAAFVRDTSHPHGKLGPRGKKCIFIRHSEHSKGYVLIGEQSDESITKIKSRDVIFLESDFPQREEV